MRGRSVAAENRLADRKLPLLPEKTQSSLSDAERDTRGAGAAAVLERTRLRILPLAFAPGSGPCSLSRKCRAARHSNPIARSTARSPGPQGE